MQNHGDSALGRLARALAAAAAAGLLFLISSVVVAGPPALGTEAEVDRPIIDTTASRAKQHAQAALWLVDVNYGGTPASQFKMDPSQENKKALVGFLNQHNIIVLDSSGEYAPDQSAALGRGTTLFRTSETGRPFLYRLYKREGKPGAEWVMYTFQQSSKEYTAKYAARDKLGDGGYTASILGTNYVHDRQSEGATLEQIEGELLLFNSLGVGILDGDRDYYKALRQRIHIYDQSGEQIGILDVREQGPNLAKIYGQTAARNKLCLEFNRTLTELSPGAAPVDERPAPARVQAALQLIVSALHSRGANDEDVARAWRFAAVADSLVGEMELAVQGKAVRVVAHRDGTVSIDGTRYTFDPVSVQYK